MDNDLTNILDIEKSLDLISNNKLIESQNVMLSSSFKLLNTTFKDIGRDFELLRLMVDDGGGVGTQTESKVDNNVNSSLVYKLSDTINVNHTVTQVQGSVPTLIETVTQQTQSSVPTLTETVTPETQSSVPTLTETQTLQKTTISLLGFIISDLIKLVNNTDIIVADVVKEPTGIEKFERFLTNLGAVGSIAGGVTGVWSLFKMRGVGAVAGTATVAGGSAGAVGVAGAAGATGTGLATVVAEAIAIVVAIIVQIAIYAATLYSWYKLAEYYVRYKAKENPFVAKSGGSAILEKWNEENGVMNQITNSTGVSSFGSVIIEKWVDENGQLKTLPSGVQSKNDGKEQNPSISGIDSDSILLNNVTTVNIIDKNGVFGELTQNAVPTAGNVSKSPNAYTSYSYDTLGSYEDVQLTQLKKEILSSNASNETTNNNTNNYYTINPVVNNTIDKDVDFEKFMAKFWASFYVGFQEGRGGLPTGVVKPM